MNRSKKFFLMWVLFLPWIPLPSVGSWAGQNSDKNLILTNPVEAGLGAVFSSVLSTLDRYEREGYGGVRVDLNRGVYLDPKRGPNYWDYFFQPVRLGNEANRSEVISQDEMSALVNAGFVMSRERGFELIQKYVHLQPCIQQEVDAFVDRNFEDFFVVGIHHRGTDKKLEVPIVPYQLLFCHVNWWILNAPPGKAVLLFVATDDQNFVEYMQALFPGRVVCNPFVRSRNERPLHYGNDGYADNYQKGKEAIIDCILLSKCHVLLFPAASAFSMAALKFNPHQIGIPLHGG